MTIVTFLTGLAAAPLVSAAQRADPLLADARLLSCEVVSAGDAEDQRESASPEVWVVGCGGIY